MPNKSKKKKTAAVVTRTAASTSKQIDKTNLPMETRKELLAKLKGKINQKQMQRSGQLEQTVIQGNSSSIHSSIKQADQQRRKQHNLMEGLQGFAKCSTKISPSQCTSNVKEITHQLRPIRLIEDFLGDLEEPTMMMMMMHHQKQEYAASINTLLNQLLYKRKRVPIIHTDNDEENY